MMMSLQWTYENYPENNQQVLLDNMWLLLKGGYDSSYYFREDVFPTQDLETLPVNGKLGGFEHVVNLAQGKARNQPAASVLTLAVMLIVRRSQIGRSYTQIHSRRRIARKE